MNRLEIRDCADYHIISGSGGGAKIAPQSTRRAQREWIKTKKREYRRDAEGAE
jgi:hypothetical protein